VVSKIERDAGGAVRVRLLARDVSIATVMPQHSSISNVLLSRISEIQDEGLDRVTLRLVIGGEHVLLSRITRRSRDQLPGGRHGSVCTGEERGVDRVK